MDDDPLVYLGPPGPLQAGVRGLRTYARGREDKAVEAFLGVPYAQPPTGRRRFRPPECLPTGLWQGVRDATKYGPACPQVVSRAEEFYSRQFSRPPRAYSEDCLYLNIWTPDSDHNGSLPVMVWIHGGGFVQGYADRYDGTGLAAHEHVVFVSINYRLGVFGFLRTGSGPEDYYGNQGLWDQLEALKWINSHIGKFGGDPNNVTLCGQSAGAMSVCALVQSSQSRGLLHKAIVQSGPITVPNAIWSAAQTEKFFWKRLRAMGFDGACHKLIEFLSGQSTDALLTAFDDWFAPVVLDHRLLDQSPTEALRSQNGAGHREPVPLMIGFNSSDGVWFVPPDLHCTQDAEKAIHGILSRGFLRGQLGPASLAKVVRLTSDLYLKDTTKPHGRSLDEAVCEFYGDINYVAPSILQAELHSQSAPTFVYYFDHRPSYSSLPHWVGADHCDEIPFVLGFPFRTDLTETFTDEERALSRRLMRHWADFARFGTPCDPDENSASKSEWKAYTADRPHYLVIRGSTPHLKDLSTFKPLKVRLWNKILPQIIDEEQNVRKTSKI